MSLIDRYDMSRAAGERAVTLLELNSMVAGLIDTCMPDAYWVEAELSEMREVRGHCYMELHGACAEGRCVKHARGKGPGAVLGHAMAHAEAAL